MDVSGSTVLVMGLGRFGGGLGVTRWLCARGAHVLLTDLSDEAALAEPLAELRPVIESGQVTLRLGGHVEQDFTDASLVVANPAVPKPWENRFLAAARRANRPITTEIQLLIGQLDRARTLGITGTAGKSTTSAMTVHVLRGVGVPTRLGGNIGGSMLGEAASLGAQELVVLELSSFMLHWIGGGGVAAPGGVATERSAHDPGTRAATNSRSGWSPRWAAITNIYPNHLDWHGSFEHYRQSKLNLLRWQGDGDHTLRGEDEVSAELRNLELPLRLPGAHNRANALLAIRMAVAATGASPAAAAATLRDFTGLPHRLELVGEHDERRFFNDSKSTTPEATLLAVEAFEDPKRVHLIAGGYDKGTDLRSISALVGRLGGFYTIGATGRGLAAAAGVGSTETLDRAVDLAMARMRSGDVLLLSPGCASWDQFTNYEARGAAFRACVERAIGQPSRRAGGHATSA